MMTRRPALAAAAGTLAFAFALTGCSGTEPNPGEETAKDSPDTASTEPTEAGGSETESPESVAASENPASGLSENADLSKESPTLTPDDAVAAAKDEADGGTLHSIELDFDRRDKAWQYEISILNGSTDFDIDVDAESGKVVEVEKDQTDDQETAVDLNDPMTFDEALDLAKGEGSGRLESWKLESDDGRTEYQFDFDDDGAETEVSVDVESERVTVDD